MSKMRDGYEEVIRHFISNQTNSDEFERDFLTYFKADKNQAPGDDFDILDQLFTDVDEYVADSRLRAATSGIDEYELRSRANSAYRRLYRQDRSFATISPEWLQNVQKYRVMIDAFIADQIDAAEFEKLYLSAIKVEKTVFPDSIYSVLQELFEDVDAYVSDPSLRTEQEDIDEGHLHSCAVRARDALRILAP